MNKVLEAVAVRASIRCKENISHEQLMNIFRNKSVVDISKYQQYLYGFFEEVYPSLLLKYIQASSLKLKDIVLVYDMLPERGEKHKFREFLNNGQFQNITF